VRVPNPSLNVDENVFEVTTADDKVFRPYSNRTVGILTHVDLAGFGAVPENLTVPLTLAAVAGSIGAAVGLQRRSDVVALRSPVLPHPVSSATASKADRLRLLSIFSFSFLLPLP